MKKLIVVCFVLISIFLFGCQLQQQQPQLALEGTNDAITSKQQPYTLKFFVINPTQTTFVGTVEYSYDKNCLRTYPDKQDVEVTPKQYRIAMTKDFTYSTSNSFGSNNDEKCINHPLQISTTLKDKGGDIKSVINVQLTISGT